MSETICLVLQAYEAVLLGRVVLSFVFMFKPGWVPPQGFRPILDLVYALTDPPINALRKVVPQPFGLPLDLAFLVWFLIIFFAHSLLCPGRAFI